MIKIPIDVNFDFSKVKITHVNEKYILYGLENMVLKLYIDKKEDKSQDFLKKAPNLKAKVY